MEGGFCKEDLLESAEAPGKQNKDEHVSTEAATVISG